MGYAERVNPACHDLDDERDVQPLQHHSVDVEEVDRKLMGWMRAVGAEDSAEWIRYATHTAAIVHQPYLLGRDPEDLEFARTAYRAVLERDNVQPSQVVSVAGGWVCSHGIPATKKRPLRRWSAR